VNIKTIFTLFLANYITVEKKNHAKKMSTVIRDVRYIRLCCNQSV